MVSGVVSTVAVLHVAGKTFQSLNRRYGAPLPPVAEPEVEIPPLPGEEMPEEASGETVSAAAGSGAESKAVRRSEMSDGQHDAAAR